MPNESLKINYTLTSLHDNSLDCLLEILRLKWINGSE